ncbi:MAG TPA: 23S rRNA (adenine(2503)-C(2))-methyltransferase RlmN [Deltaproteobacteria bacterium]|nr:23S rRNA (adenine(2503)-C(2))-methyltransferase RlmN [Deltaproteobacteria bacterium]
MINLLDLNKENLASVIDDKPYRAAQIFNWVFGKGLRDIEKMSNIPRKIRHDISHRAYIGYPEVAQIKRSSDNTEKIAYALEDGNIIESVLIPEKDHWSICVSSQAGCAMGCTFCCTARLGFTRNLSLGEIISQVLFPVHTYPERNFRNVVFMGMGEPLLNYENVVKAISIITDPDGPRISKRRITVSTCGILEMMPFLWKDTGAGLAVSLNATTQAQRSAIMPITRKYPLTGLIDALRAYQLPNRRRITIEYVLLGGFNDSREDARRLIGLLHGLKVKVNIIPLNPWPGCPFNAPDEKTVLAFEERLKDSPVAVMLRKEKGNDISAACGQLAGGTLNVDKKAC